MQWCVMCLLQGGFPLVVGVFGRLNDHGVVTALFVHLEGDLVVLD